MKPHIELPAETFPKATKMRFGIVVSEWSSNITGKLLKGATDTFIKHGVKEDNIVAIHVPGSFELIAGARLVAKKLNVDAVVCLGCIVKGETPHFEYVCQGTTQGIAHLNVKFDIPFVFGVLTTQNIEQAEERAGGTFGNKGEEAAITALKMVSLNCKIKKSL